MAQAKPRGASERLNGKDMITLKKNRHGVYEPAEDFPRESNIVAWLLSKPRPKFTVWWLFFAALTSWLGVEFRVPDVLLWALTINMILANMYAIVICFDAAARS